jgi:ankyrin repeat protein
VNAEPAEEGGRTALQEAAEACQPDTVDLLLKARARVYARPAPTRGLDALQAAAWGGSLEIVNRLLASGADANSEPSKKLGRRALEAATKAGHLEVVRCLLEAGANVNAKSTNCQQTAIEVARAAKKTDIVEVILAAEGKDHVQPSQSAD